MKEGFVFVLESSTHSNGLEGNIYILPLLIDFVIVLDGSDLVIVSVNKKVLPFFSSFFSIFIL